jgi:hypothetical protein
MRPVVSDHTLERRLAGVAAGEWRDHPPSWRLHSRGSCGEAHRAPHAPAQRARVEEREREGEREGGCQPTWSTSRSAAWLPLGEGCALEFEGSLSCEAASSQPPAALLLHIQTADEHRFPAQEKGAQFELLPRAADASQARAAAATLPVPDATTAAHADTQRDIAEMTTSCRGSAHLELVSVRSRVHAPALGHSDESTDALDTGTTPPHPASALTPSLALSHTTLATPFPMY